MVIVENRSHRYTYMKIITNSAPQTKNRISIQVQPHESHMESEGGCGTGQQALFSTIKVIRLAQPLLKIPRVVLGGAPGWPN